MKSPQRLSTSERCELLGAPTLTLAQTAQVLGVGLSALRDALRRGELEIQVISVGKRKIVPTASVRALLKVEDQEPIAHKVERRGLAAPAFSTPIRNQPIQLASHERKQ